MKSKLLGEQPPDEVRRLDGQVDIAAGEASAAESADVYGLLRLEDLVAGVLWIRRD
jgi:hypothetical protein